MPNILNGIEILSKRRELLKAIKAINLAMSRGNPPAEHLTTKKSLIFCTSALSIRALLKTIATLSPVLNCLHYLIFITVNNKVITKGKPCIFQDAKTKWSYFQKLLMIILDNSISLETDGIVCAVESFKPYRSSGT